MFIDWYYMQNNFFKSILCFSNTEWSHIFVWGLQLPVFFLLIISCVKTALNKRQWRRAFIFTFLSHCYTQLLKHNKHLSGLCSFFILFSFQQRYIMVTNITNIDSFFASQNDAINWLWYVWPRWLHISLINHYIVWVQFITSPLY